MPDEKILFKIRKGKYPEENVQLLREQLAKEGIMLGNKTIGGIPYYRWEGPSSKKPEYATALQSDMIGRRSAIKRIGAYIAVGVAASLGIGVLLSSIPRIKDAGRIVPGDPEGSRGIVRGVVVRELLSYSDEQQKFTYYNLWLKEEGVSVHGKSVPYWQRVNFDVDQIYDYYERRLGIEDLEARISENSTFIELEAVKTVRDPFYESDPDKDVFWDDFEATGKILVIN